MGERIDIDRRFAVGIGQPDTAEFAALANEGFRSVVNFRAAGEAGHDAEVEGEAVRAAGMTYLHFPIGPRDFTPESLDEFHAAAGELPNPVYLHCGSSRRAALFGIAHVAVERSLSGEEALAFAEERGIDLDPPQLKQFFASYIASRQR